MGDSRCGTDTMVVVVKIEMTLREGLLQHKADVADDRQYIKELESRCCKFKEEVERLSTGVDMLQAEIAGYEEHKQELIDENVRLKDEWYSPAHMAAVQERTIDPLRAVLEHSQNLLAGGGVEAVSRLENAIAAFLTTEQGEK